eukprot:6399437-Karenia_brevis.AAC.1
MEENRQNCTAGCTLTGLSLRWKKSNMARSEPTLGPGGQDMGFKISMSAAAAVSEGASPYYAPGMAILYDGFRSRQTPQGLETRGFKRACEFSEVENRDGCTKAKMMETCIFTSYPSTQQILKEVAQQATA